jgi:acyl-CoA synthetase (AMP-forming)/AMP-acid ligase II
MDPESAAGVGLATPSTRLLLDRRRRQPGRVAFVEGVSGRRLRWEDVGATADSWSARHLPAGTRIGLHLADPLAAAAHFLAALATGTAVAPLNPDGTPTELQAQARATGLAGVVTDSADPDVAAAFAAAGAAPLSADDKVWRPAEVRPVAGSSAALIMASSGTTGAPKLIPLTEQQLLHTAGGVASHLGLDATQRGFSPLPLFHINGLVVGVLAALVSGSSLVVDRRFSLRSVWSVVEREDVTWLNLVPAILSLLGAGDGGPAPAGVRLARSASAPLAPAIRDRFEARFAIPVIETYGMTEAGSQITANPVRRNRPGSVGLPVGVDLRVVDGRHRPLAPGRTGGVEIRGAGVTPSYWIPAGPRSGPEVVPSTRCDGWLATGDVGHVDPDGYVYLTGRADDVINRAGEKVRPREIEEVILGDPRVGAAVVVGRPHPTLGEEPVAYVLPAAGAGDHGLLARDLGAACAAALSRFKRPVEIVVAEDLPSGPTGKVRRAQVREMAAAAAELR